MRIMFANSLYAPEFGGGAERVLHELARGLARRGAAVGVFTTGEHETVENVDGVEVFRFPIDNDFRKYKQELPGKLGRAKWQVRDLRSPLMAQRFEQAIKSFRPDLIHFHNLAGLTRSIWPVPRAMGIPSVQVLHDLYLICPTSSMLKRGIACHTRCMECRLFRARFPAASRAVSAVVGVSRFVLDRVIAEGLFEGAVQQVIHNAIAQASPSPRPAGPHLKFGFIGSLTEPKGAGWLIDQFDNSMGELLIAGTGPQAYVDGLKARAAGKAVTFLGFASSASFFSMIDVGVVPSLWNDTLPSVAIEASAHGRPVIASRLGGLPEIVRDGETGILVDPDQPDSLGAAMRSLARSPESVAAMAQAAPAAVSRFIDFESYLDRYEALHNRLLDSAL